MDINTPKVILIYARPGHGKTTFLKRLSASIRFSHLYIISASLHDDYKESELKKFGLPKENIHTNHDFIYEELCRFRSITNEDGTFATKLLILDDVLHLNTTAGNIAREVRDIFSTQRHYTMYIIVSVQLLKALGKALRYTAHTFITGSIDDESVTLMSNITGWKKVILNNIQLMQHEFLIGSNTGGLLKMSTIKKKPSTYVNRG